MKKKHMGITTNHCSLPETSPFLTICETQDTSQDVQIYRSTGKQKKNKNEGLKDNPHHRTHAQKHTHITYYVLYKSKSNHFASFSAEHHTSVAGIGSHPMCKCRRYRMSTEACVHNVHDVRCIESQNSVGGRNREYLVSILTTFNHSSRVIPRSFRIG